jgi:hypothetical protein
MTRRPARGFASRRAGRFPGEMAALVLISRDAGGGPLGAARISAVTLSREPTASAFSSPRPLSQAPRSERSADPYGIAGGSKPDVSVLDRYKEAA